MAPDAIIKYVGGVILFVASVGNYVLEHKNSDKINEEDTRVTKLEEQDKILDQELDKFAVLLKLQHPDNSQEIDKLVEELKKNNNK